MTGNSDYVIRKRNQHAKQHTKKGGRLSNLIIFSHAPPQKKKKAVKEKISTAFFLRVIYLFTDVPEVLCHLFIHRYPAL